MGHYIGLLRGWAVVYLSTRLGLQWLGNVFAHLLKLPLEFFEKRHLGDVVSRKCTWNRSRSGPRAGRMNLTDLEPAMSPPVTAKQEVAQLLTQLPDDATLEDIQYHVYVLEKIQRGRADIAAGRSYTSEQARERLARWLPH